MDRNELIDKRIGEALSKGEGVITGGVISIITAISGDKETMEYRAAELMERLFASSEQCTDQIMGKRVAMTWEDMRQRYIGILKMLIVELEKVGP